MATANHWPKLPAFPYLHIAKDRIYKTGFALQKDAFAALINNTVIGTVIIHNDNDNSKNGVHKVP